MPTLLLLRHGRTNANTQGVLAGHMPGVALDEHGLAQVATVAKRLAGLPIVAAVSSPLPRCQETIRTALGDRDLTVDLDDDIAEFHYGDWQGRPLKELANEPLWKTVQDHPSAAVFPNGEPPAVTAARAVAAVRRHDARIAEEHGPDALWLACTHGDVIKSIVTDAVGAHFDMFQRVIAATASITVIRYTPARSFLIRLNDTGGDLSDLVGQPEKPRHGAAANAVGESDGVVGGGR